MALSELLLYALFAGFVLLFNLITQWLSKRRGEQGEEGAAPPLPPPPPQAGEDGVPPPRPLHQRMEEFWGRDAEPASVSASAPMAPGDWQPAGPARRPPPEALASIPARRRSLRAYLKLGSKGDLRQAIVTMTILQPCRALAPFDADDGPARR